MNDWRVFDSEASVAEPTRMLPDFLNRLAFPAADVRLRQFTLLLNEQEAAEERPVAGHHPVAQLHHPQQRRQAQQRGQPPPADAAEDE